MLGVFLEPASVYFPPTYITAISRYAVKITNNSDKIRKISFYTKSDKNEESLEKQQLDLYDTNQRCKLLESPLFNNEVFRIEPQTLELYPHASNEIIVEFLPQVAQIYNVTAYMEIDNQYPRILFNLSGNGLPPAAYFNPDSIVIGHVNLDCIYEYDVELINNGDVIIDFHLEKKETSCQFIFEPSSGIIPIKGSMIIHIQFIPTAVGNFMETFTFNVRGAINIHPIITLSGKVIGPSFSINPRRIDFGGVGYGFLHTAKLEIENKSEIPFDYKLRMSIDGSFERREFQIIPESGTIQKYGKSESIIEFIPISIRSYDLKIYFDIEKYAEKLCEIPVTATCFCPSLTLTPETLDFQDIFIGHKYTKNVVLKNDTDYAAKYEFIKQNPATSKFGLIEVIKDTGIINPRFESQIPISFTGVHIGHLNIECFFSILGSDKPPMKLITNANCVGPDLDISSKLINFGNAKVLTNYEKTVTIANNSLIPAKFKAYFEPELKVFSVEPLEALINPNETVNMVVSANLTDVLSFATNLKLQFDYLNTIVIPVRANGIGTPIISSIPMDVIDLGYVLTDSPSIVKFTLTNYSDRVFEIRWSNQKAKSGTSDQSVAKYSIVPDCIQIMPEHTEEFVITLKCNKIQSFSMVLMCNSTVGRSRNEIFTPTLKASFIRPLVSLSTNSLEFVQICNPVSNSEDRSNLQPSKELLKKIEKSLSITNKSQITLHVSIDCPSPFSCSLDEFIIDSGQVIDLLVYFDTSFKTDFNSETILRKIAFNFVDHPQTVYVNLKGSIQFPNVSFSVKDNIDFGVAMMNTEQSKSIEMKNIFAHTIRYEWELMSGDSNISKAFDVFPLRGELEAGQTIETHFGYFALADLNGKLRTYNATAICHINGGPDYQFHLKGLSASINYRIEPLNFELINRNFSEEIEEVLTIYNTSKVPFNFSIQIPKLTQFKHFSAYPLKGTIEANQSQEIQMHIVPGLPQQYRESLTVNIGGFEDVKVNVAVEAEFSQVSMAIPRDENDLSYQAIVNEFNKKKLLTMKVQQSRLVITQESTNEEEDAQEEESNVDVSLDQLLQEEKVLFIDHLKSKLNFLSNARSTEFYVAKYVFDFGELIFGETRKESIPITNQSNFPISFDINQDRLKRTGFKIEPISFKEIQSKETVTFDIIFNPLNRKNTELGLINYNIPITFDDDHNILLIIKANLKLPDLTFSQYHFDFGPVIIGQTKIMWLELRNLNNVSCEFQFGPAENMNILQKNTHNISPNVFTVLPESGVLPPSSYLNISIQYSPDSEKPVQMQFPLMLKHALAPSYITVEGKGILLQLVFDPINLILDSVLPFSMPSTADVTITNPTDYPIEFYSLQFDQQLYNDTYQDPRKAESPFVTYSAKTKTPNKAAKFSICIIVSGPPLSGKTTVCKYLSQMYNLPIVDLNEVWKDQQPDDYVKLLFAFISKPEYRNGFIVDGLPCDDETILKDNDAFISQCLKTKNAQDEALKDIPLSFQHQTLSSYERVLDYLLSSLDGHYVYHVALRLTLAIATKRRENIEKKERSMKRHLIKDEKNRLFNMTENEYENLTIEAKQAADEKRKQIRDKVVGKYDEEANAQTVTTSKHSKKSKSHSKHTESRKDLPAVDTASMSSTSTHKKSKSKTTPADPLEQLVQVYTFSLGSLITKLQSPSDRFKSLDPLEIIQFDQEAILHVSNTVLINSEEIFENIYSQITSFLPPLKVLKETVFKLLIPESSIQDTVASSDLLKQPAYYSIITDDLNTKLTPHWKLNPKSEMTLSIQYDPLMPGINKDELKFAICSSSSPPNVLKVYGECYFPQFDRNLKSIFPLVLKKFDQKQVPAYITETSTYNLGYVLVAKERTAKQPMAYHAPMTFINTTSFQCEVTCYFTEPIQKNTWTIEPASFTIPPTTSQEEPSKTVCQVGFHPTVPNSYNANVTIMVKDNPEPFFLKLAADCFSPQVEISPLTIDFDKVLINVEKTMKIDIKNIEKLPAYWRLKGSNTLTGIVSFSAIEGTIQPGKSTSIILTFLSSKPQQVKKPIQIEILDEQKVRIFRTETIQISGEAFDVNFDIVIPKTGNEQFDFGQLKVGQSKTLQMSVKNKGKYPVLYKFTLADKTLSKYLAISPMDGTSPVNDKGTPINITFKGTNVCIFANRKAINLKVTETQTNSVTIQQSFTFSARTCYNQFSVSSGKLVNFGICQVGIVQKKEFTITNEGIFPFEYEFIPQLTTTEESKGKEADTNSKNKPVAKPKTKPKASNSITFGPFTLFPSTGVLQPNASLPFTIEFVSSEIGNFKESVQLSVPDSNPANSNFIIKFAGNSYQPSIELKDNEKIFPDLALCIRTDLSRKDITCFIEDEKIVHFAPRIINSQDSITICLSNQQPIECVADISIKSKSKINPFEIKDKSIVIPANSSKTSTISFTPPGTDTYSASFEAIIKSQTPSPPLKFGLEGTGSIPAITMKTQLDKSKSGFSVNFGKTLIGYDKTKTIAIGNDTPLPAMISLAAKATPDFGITGVDSSKPFPLEPNHQFTFGIIHQPQKVRKGQFDIVIQVAENPKSSISLTCIGEGFSEDLIFEGLEGEDRELHFRDTVVGRNQTMTFSMKNVSDSAIRFNWVAQNDITFSPRVGHISRNQMKEITAYFYSEKPLKLNAAKGACQFSKIELVDSTGNDWDDSKKVVSFVPRSEIEAEVNENWSNSEMSHQVTPKSVTPKDTIRSKSRMDHDLVKVTSPIAEPPYNIVTAGKPKELPIKIFAVADNIKCSIDVTDISFAPTMMFQTRTAEVKITNVCQIRMEYQWITEKFESLRTDYSSTRPSCFSIEPSTGFIEAGQSKVFNVMFSPMEVDDFVCTMKCQIPYLNSMDPPKLNMNGLSRRPLCHFNITVSDYLTRRHPDYTYSLPENVKVIELFSKGMKNKSIKKLEIVNPTSTPYETTWTLLSDYSNGSIRVENTQALVSSGKHYYFLVAFLPSSAKLVESLWEFSILDHNIKIPFLFVGRISH